MALDPIQSALDGFGVDSFSTLLRDFQASDDRRNDLIKVCQMKACKRRYKRVLIKLNKHLVDRCNKLDQQYRDKSDDYDSEQVTRRHWQNLAQDLKREKQAFVQQAVSSFQFRLLPICCHPSNINKKMNTFVLQNLD